MGLHQLRSEPQGIRPCSVRDRSAIEQVVELPALIRIEVGGEDLKIVQRKLLFPPCRLEQRVEPVLIITRRISGNDCPVLEQGIEPVTKLLHPATFLDGPLEWDAVNRC